MKKLLIGKGKANQAIRPKRNKINTKNLISFGTYLLSENRTVKIKNSYNQDLLENENAYPLNERLKVVHDADVQNWIDSKKIIEKNIKDGDVPQQAIS
jgi:hypothetical protein